VVRARASRSRPARRLLTARTGYPARTVIAATTLAGILSGLRRRRLARHLHDASSECDASQGSHTLRRLGSYLCEQVQWHERVFLPAPGTTCGSASCTGKSFQATGVCGNGACGLPVAQTCGGACVASLGCVDCSPSTKQCSSSGVPQLCSTNGTWQNLNGCQNGNTCLAGDCQCSSPRTTCSNVCIDTTSDTSNCGGCSHLCLGGTCLSGACQAAVTVASTGSSGATLIGVDSSSVYYAVPDPTDTSVTPTLPARLAQSTAVRRSTAWALPST